MFCLQVKCPHALLKSGKRVLLAGILTGFMKVRGRACDLDFLTMVIKS